MLAVVTASIILMWFLCASVLVGMGALLLRGLRCRVVPVRRILVWSICRSGFPAGLPLFPANRRHHRGAGMYRGPLWTYSESRQVAGTLRNDTRIGIWPAVCCIPILLVIAVRCSGAAVHFDTGFYGATAVRWFVTYPLVPGLANLVGQLGFNSNVFLCVAVMNKDCGLKPGFTYSWAYSFAPS